MMETKQLTRGQGIDLLIASIPYPEQIKNADLEKEGAIYFTWRSYRYKFNLGTLGVDLSNGCLLEGNDASTLMTQLIWNTYKKFEL